MATGEEARPEINGKVVIISGASSGFGKATGHRLAKSGTKLVLGARREGRLVALRDAIVEQSGDTIYRATAETTKQPLYPGKRITNRDKRRNQ